MRRTSLLLALLAINLYVTAHRIRNSSTIPPAKLGVRDKQVNRYKEIGSGGMTPVIFKAIKEQQKEIEELKIELAKIKSRMKRT